MQPEINRVVRQHIRYFPTSSTEVNVDRLPSRNSLKTMKLRYREEVRGEDGSEQRRLFWTTLLLAAGFVCTWLLISGPRELSFVLPRIRAVDGAMIIVEMLGGMLILVGLLSLFFVPSRVRAVIVSWSAIALAGSLGIWFSRCFETVLISCALNMIFAVQAKRTIASFHEQWLRADPRVDEEKHAAWLNQNKSGNSWCLPAFRGSTEIFYRYLGYEPLCSGAAGVWMPSSSGRKRVLVVSLFSGATFVLLAIISAGTTTSKLADIGFGLIGSGAWLMAVAFWVFGATAGASRLYEELFALDERSWWQRHVDRLRRSGHVAIDKISGAPIREAEHLFLGVEPWQNFPVLLHLPILYDHTYIVGRTGSGKTSIGLMQLLIQIIGGLDVPEDDPK